MSRCISRRLALSLSSLALAMLVGAAPDPEQSDGRYRMSPAEGGAYLRLDTQTGVTSVCRRKAGGWACEAAADDRRTLETEIDRLAAENAELKGAVKRLEDLLGLPDADAKSTKRGFNLKLPSEQDVDKAMDYVQGMVRKLKERWREMKEPERRSYSNRWDPGERWDRGDRRYDRDRWEDRDPRDDRYRRGY